MAPTGLYFVVKPGFLFYKQQPVSMQASWFGRSGWFAFGPRRYQKAISFAMSSPSLPRLLVIGLRRPQRPSLQQQPRPVPQLGATAKGGGREWKRRVDFQHEFIPVYGDLMVVWFSSFQGFFALLKYTPTRDGFDDVCALWQFIREITASTPDFLRASRGRCGGSASCPGFPNP